jgi:hypothetical protein
LRTARFCDQRMPSENASRSTIIAPATIRNALLP